MVYISQCNVLLFHMELLARNILATLDHHVILIRNGDWTIIEHWENLVILLAFADIKYLYISSITYIHRQYKQHPERIPVIFTDGIHRHFYSDLVNQLIRSKHV